MAQLHRISRLSVVAASSMLFTPATTLAQTAPRFVLADAVRIDAAQHDLSEISHVQVSRRGEILVPQD